MPWYRVTYTTKGFTVNTPRWTTVFGKDLQSKDWSGYPAGVKPRAIPEILLRLMEIGMSLLLFNFHPDEIERIAGDAEKTDG